MFDNLSYIKLEICLKANEKAIIPAYHGSMFRGVIGQTLRKVSCTSKGNKCFECKYSSLCPYANVFYCVNNDDTNLLKKVNTIPNPFVIYPLMNGVTSFNKGDLLKFNITLIGKATLYIHYFIYAVLNIKNLGIGVNRKRFETVYIKDVDTNKMIVENKIINKDNINTHTLLIQNTEVKNITFEFDTPLRIKNEGRFTENISFYLLMKNILRRITMIYEYFTDSQLDIDYKKILDNSKQIKTSSINLRWEKLNRYSSRAGRKLSIGGVMGKVGFEGEFTDYYAFIQAGKLLHIGKGCTVGLGHYNIKAC